MYDLDAVKAKYPAVEWTAEAMKSLKGDDLIEIVAKCNGGGHIVQMPKQMADERGLMGAAFAVVHVLRNKGFLPPTEAEVAIREYFASKGEAS